MFRKKAPDDASPFWIATSDLPTTPVYSFCQRLDPGLSACHFGDEVRRLAALAGAPAQRGTLPAVCEAPVEVRLGDLADGTDLAERGMEVAARA